MGLTTLQEELSFRNDFYLVLVVRVADIHVAWLVYVRTYCVPIATLNQNKRSRLLHLSDAHIKSSVSTLEFSHLRRNIDPFTTNVFYVLPMLLLPIKQT